MDLPHSDDCFIVAFPAETTEAFLEGHVRAFAYFDGVPTRILYDTTKIAVAKILTYSVPGYAAKTTQNPPPDDVHRNRICHGWFQMLPASAGWLTSSGLISGIVSSTCPIWRPGIPCCRQWSRRHLSPPRWRHRGR